MKTTITLHTSAINGGAFNCFPAMVHELEPERIRCNDIVLPWERHPYGMKLYVIGNEFGAMGAVWAGNDQDAFDELCDAGLSGGLMVDHEPHPDGEPDESVSFLGNAGEPHDLTNAWIAPVSFDLVRDAALLCKLAESRGAQYDDLRHLA